MRNAPLPADVHMSSLREVLVDADNRHVAVGHFNFSELVVLKAGSEAASPSLSSRFPR